LLALQPVAHPSPCQGASCCKMLMPSRAEPTCCAALCCNTRSKMLMPSFINLLSSRLCLQLLLSSCACVLTCPAQFAAAGLPTTCTRDTVPHAATLQQDLELASSNSNPLKLFVANWHASILQKDTAAAAAAAAAAAEVQTAMVKVPSGHADNGSQIKQPKNAHKSISHFASHNRTASRSCALVRERLLQQQLATRGHCSILLQQQLATRGHCSIHYRAVLVPALRAVL
jgi:hypothetical protein